MHLLSITMKIKFILLDCCFSVQVVKNERGLGISVYGGIDANVPYRGLIRIKRLFPNQSAWSTGALQPGDILLEANEIPLTGLTNHVSFFLLPTVFLLVFKIGNSQSSIQIE